MEMPVCTTCRRPKGAFTCGPCGTAVCKKCAHFVRESTFSFLEKAPANILHDTYCGGCFTEIVATALQAYESTMDQAKSIRVYLKNQGEETRLIKRSEKPIVIADCADREETLLRLAFIAAQRNFNTLVDVQIVAKKSRTEVYQTLRWQGSGVPVRLEGKKLSLVEWSAPTNNVGTR